MYLSPIPQVSKEQLQQELATTKREIANETAESRKFAIQRRYQEFMKDRQPYLDEARELSNAVLSFLYPPDNCKNPFQNLQANQSLVVKGLINLSKKLSSTIFPANGRFFSTKIMPMYLEQIAALAKSFPMQEDRQAVEFSVTDTNNRLLNRDDRIRQKIKASNDSENHFHATLHALAGGEACFCKPHLGNSKVYTIEKFVCAYDSAGNVTEVITEDSVHISNFTEEQLKKLTGYSDPELFEKKKQTDLPVYTRQIRRFDHWEIQVEIMGERFEEMEGTEPLDSPPFIVFPFMLIPGKSNGISYLSINKGDIYQFENLALTINQLTKVASKVLFHFPSQMKMTQKELARVEDEAGIQVVFGDGQYIPQAIIPDVSKNIASIQQLFEQTRAALMQAFLMEQAVVRDAERVTQEEIRTVMEGLQNLLGGLYISVARRFQFPYIRRINRLMEESGELEPLPSDVVDIVLTAGQETLEDAENLQRLDNLIGPLMQSTVFAPKINVDEYTTRRGNFLGVPVQGLLLSDEEIYQKQGIAELVETAKSFGPQGPQMLNQLAASLPTLMASGAIGVNGGGAPSVEGENPMPPEGPPQAETPQVPPTEGQAQ